MTLTGILKNILLVIISVLIWRTPITALQLVGYSIALAGLVYYSLGRDQIVSLYHTALAYAKGGYEAVRGGSSSSDEEGGQQGGSGGSGGISSSGVRKVLIAGVAAFIVMALVGGFFYGGTISSMLSGRVQEVVGGS
jgi:hypothetical protein